MEEEDKGGDAMQGEENDNVREAPAAHGQEPELGADNPAATDANGEKRLAGRLFLQNQTTASWLMPVAQEA